MKSVNMTIGNKTLAHSLGCQDLPSCPLDRVRGSCLYSLLSGSPTEPPLVTMVHGDFKSANMVFRNVESPEPTVASFDWQWTGPGVGATDLIYLCAMSLADEVWRVLCFALFAPGCPR